MFVIRKINIDEIVKAVLQIMSVRSVNLDNFFFFENLRRTEAFRQRYSYEKAFWKYVGRRKRKKPCRAMISIKFQRVIIFCRPTAPRPRSRTPALFTFLRPPAAQITFSLSPCIKLIFHGPELSKSLFHAPVGNGRRNFLYFCIVTISNFSIEAR